MNPPLSANTQAILLLTAPLIAGRAVASSPLLTPGEIKRLARHLRELQRQPADLLSPDAAELLRACQPVVDGSRLKSLLERGFQLSQALERWQARAIWVRSRADADYPRRLVERLRDDAPAVLYGCGEMSLLGNGGLAVVGSRNVDEVLIEYTQAVGRLAARAGKMLVSGGARGIDQAAMHGALEAGGRVCGVLADSLEKSVLNREHRNLLLEGQLVLISPYDPGAGFNVGNAMQRNKLIYALADASLVVSSDLNKGGTWTGAIEQLEKLRLVPVYIRSTGESSMGLAALGRRGAIPWPNPQNVDEFEAVLDSAPQLPITSRQSGLSLFSDDEPVQGSSMPTAMSDTAPISEAVTERRPLILVTSARLPDTLAAAPANSLTQESKAEQEADFPDLRTNLIPAEALFKTVREVMHRLLKAPKNDAEVAEALEVSNAQAKVWLQRLVEEGTLEKLRKPTRYVKRSQVALLSEEVQDHGLERTAVRSG